MDEGCVLVPTICIEIKVAFGHKHTRWWEMMDSFWWRVCEGCCIGLAWLTMITHFHWETLSNISMLAEQPIGRIIVYLCDVLAKATLRDCIYTSNLVSRMSWHAVKVCTCALILKDGDKAKSNTLRTPLALTRSPIGTTPLACARRPQKREGNDVKFPWKCKLQREYGVQFEPNFPHSSLIIALFTLLSIDLLFSKMAQKEPLEL